MDILRVYFNGDDGKFRSLEFATSSWYHKPQVISAIAYQLQHYCNICFLLPICWVDDEVHFLSIL